jgi:hypothetical protein
MDRAGTPARQPWKRRAGYNRQQARFETRSLLLLFPEDNEMRALRGLFFASSTRELSTAHAEGQDSDEKPVLT